jgi:hypothetical protein
MNHHSNLQPKQHKDARHSSVVPSEIQSLNFGLFDVEELERRLEMIPVPPDCTTDICMKDEGPVCSVNLPGVPPYCNLHY